MKGKGLHMVAFILLIIGGLNWLLYGLFSWEIGALIDTVSPMLSRVVYILVGVAAVYEVATHKSRCKACEKTVAAAPSGN